MAHMDTWTAYVRGFSRLSPAEPEPPASSACCNVDSGDGDDGGECDDGGGRGESCHTRIAATTPALQMEAMMAVRTILTQPG